MGIKHGQKKRQKKILYKVMSEVLRRVGGHDGRNIKTSLHAIPYVQKISVRNIR